MTSTDLVNRVQAIELLGSEWIFDELRKAGDLRPAGFVEGDYGGRRRPLFRRAHVDKHIAARQRREQGPGADWLAIAEAVARFEFTKETLLRWRTYCPTLRRPIGRKRWQGRLYLSRQDLQRCFDLRDNPEEQRCPGNAGVWRDRSIYAWSDPATQQERQYVTVPYTAEACKAHKGLVFIWVENAKAPDGGPFDCRQVNRPSPKNPHGGKEWVIALEHVERIAAWRRGEGGSGQWLEEGRVRLDAEEWVSNPWLQQQYDVSDFWATNWRKKGKLRRRKVTRPFPGQYGGRAKVWVYALSDVRAIRGESSQGAAKENTAAPSPLPASGAGATKSSRQRGRPASVHTEDVKKLCYEEYVAGSKLSVIVEKARRLFGDRAAPKQPGHVITYAQRYAEDQKLAPPSRPT
jgi:hypothetical protein